MGGRARAMSEDGAQPRTVYCLTLVGFVGPDPVGAWRRGKKNVEQNAVIFAVCDSVQMV